MTGASEAISQDAMRLGIDDFSPGALTCKEMVGRVTHNPGFEQAKGIHVGISALHVRPGQSGSHEPYIVNLVRALSTLDTAHRFTLFATPLNQFAADHGGRA
jgi:hypothetical protein